MSCNSKEILELILLILFLGFINPKIVSAALAHCWMWKSLEAKAEVLQRFTEVGNPLVWKSESFLTWNQVPVESGSYRWINIDAI